MSNNNPFRSLEFQDNKEAVQTNLKQIKNRWDTLMAHLSRNTVSKAAVAQNSTDIGSLQAQIDAMQKEIDALQTSSSDPLLYNFLLMGA